MKEKLISLCVPDVFVIKITEALGPHVTFAKSSMGIHGSTLYLFITLKCHIVFHLCGDYYKCIYLVYCNSMSACLSKK